MDSSASTMHPSLPVSSAFSQLTASSSRSSPRARRDTPLLPSFDTKPSHPHPTPFARSATSFKHARERRSYLHSLLHPCLPSLCRFLPWLAIILIWFTVGYHLHIRSSTSPTVQTTESEIAVTVQRAESEQVSEMPREKEVAMAVTEHGVQFGSLVGPFGDTERRMVGIPVHGKGQGQGQGQGHGHGHGGCPGGAFGEIAKRTSFVVVFHELSMTGAPLAMLELAGKVVRCGGKVTAVILNKRGGLYDEVVARGISVVRDKGIISWRTAAKADLVVASSAACNAWIEMYFRHNRKGGDHLIWWMMENRREYFERSKRLLGKAHALVFLSATQEQLWRQWATENALALPSVVKVVSLSVSDELAASSGLDDEAGTVNNFLEVQRKREMLRDLVRKEMGLLPSDYLVISLSSINPGKGQLLLLQAALMVAREKVEDVLDLVQESLDESSDETAVEVPTKKRALKILLGSVGSKSNKPEYLERIHDLLDKHSNLAEMLLWTEATVDVAPLYAAADAYVMNAQGAGETFGRVTIEAMAFGLPVLGTDAGGTKEIIQPNVTGLLHPPGHIGVPGLAYNLQWLLSHPERGRDMGKKGRARVQAQYREAPMYEAMASVFIDSVRERGE